MNVYWKSWLILLIFITYYKLITVLRYCTLNGFSNYSILQLTLKCILKLDKSFKGIACLRNLIDERLSVISDRSGVRFYFLYSLLVHVKKFKVSMTWPLVSIICALFLRISECFNCLNILNHNILLQSMRNIWNIHLSNVRVLYRNNISLREVI